MKKKLGLILGFIVGFASFLFMWKMLFLTRITPEDELAPGAVMVLAVIVGGLFGYFGIKIQKYHVFKFK
ncbi:MAG TPA: hypothetical protein PLY70_06875 [Saprospiraceae bacterium]|nr:hypothetical protein [Saprospiraceae bacterium]HPN71300.1 hypothetical protein [Saprospiraceae bacterium]